MPAEEKLKCPDCYGVGKRAEVLPVEITNYKVEWRRTGVWEKCSTCQGSGTANP